MCDENTPTDKGPTHDGNCYLRQQSVWKLHRNSSRQDFPGVISCTDGSHIAVKAPAAETDSYTNRKDIFITTAADFPKTAGARWCCCSPVVRLTADRGLDCCLHRLELRDWTVTNGCCWCWGVERHCSCHRHQLKPAKRTGCDKRTVSTPTLASPNQLMVVVLWLFCWFTSSRQAVNDTARIFWLPRLLSMMLACCRIVVSATYLWIISCTTRSSFICLVMRPTHCFLACWCYFETMAIWHHNRPPTTLYTALHGAQWGGPSCRKGQVTHRNFVSDPFCYVSGADEGFASVNVLSVCDNKIHFKYVYAARAGSVHDAHVLRVSSLGNMLEASAWPSSGENNLHLLGDSAYPLLPNLLVPYRDNGYFREDTMHYIAQQDL